MSRDRPSSRAPALASPRSAPMDRRQSSPLISAKREPLSIAIQQQLVERPSRVSGLARRASFVVDLEEHPTELPHSQSFPIVLHRCFASFGGCGLHPDILQLTSDWLLRSCCRPVPSRT